MCKATCMRLSAVNSLSEWLLVRGTHSKIAASNGLQTSVKHLSSEFCILVMGEALCCHDGVLAGEGLKQLIQLPTSDWLAVGAAAGTTC